MPKCVHKDVCREYMKKFGSRISKNCTDSCKYYQAIRQDVFELDAKQISDIVADAFVDAQCYQGKKYR